MATIIHPAPVFTSELEKLVADFMAGSIRPLPADFNLLHYSYGYVHKVLSTLMRAGVLTYTQDQPRSVRFTPKGLEHLRAEMPMAYAYYMAISNQNHPGTSDAQNSAMHLFMRFPSLKSKLWDGHLWNPAYFVATVSENTT